MSPATHVASPAERSQERSLTLRILPAVAFNFVLYLCIGMPLAILPTYVHHTFGVNAVIAGLVVSLQYIATFASRPYAGHLSDTIGPKRTVRYGLLACAASGALMLAAALLAQNEWLSLGTLSLSRLALGVAESMGSTGAMMWGIGRVGSANTARVISWNGITTYSALALGAPLGALLEPRWGMAAVAILVMLLSLGSLYAATRMAATVTGSSKRVPIGQIFFGVLPYGMGLAIGGMGFGVLATFITLYFAHLHWPGAPLSLTIYGLSFVGTRLVFSGLIDRFGGFPVAVISFLIEAVGMALLGAVHTQPLAYVASAFTGVGFSLIFPALGVEAARAFPPSTRGAVLAVYCAFVDLSLFLTGPLAGAVIHNYGYPAVFRGISALICIAMAGAAWLGWRAYSAGQRASA